MGYELHAGGAAGKNSSPEGLYFGNGALFDVRHLYGKQRGWLRCSAAFSVRAGRGNNASALVSAGLAPATHSAGRSRIP